MTHILVEQRFVVSNNFWRLFVKTFGPNKEYMFVIVISTVVTEPATPCVCDMSFKFYAAWFVCVAFIMLYWSWALWHSDLKPGNFVIAGVSTWVAWLDIAVFVATDALFGFLVEVNSGYAGRSLPPKLLNIVAARAQKLMKITSLRNELLCMIL